MAYVITQKCTREADCVEACPVDCIVPGHPVADWPLFYIDPDTCINCGACVPVCPPEAIYADTDLPAEHRSDASLNARFFTEGPGYQSGIDLYALGRRK